MSPGEGAEHDEPAPLIDLSLEVTNQAGRGRQGRAVVLPRWLADPRSQRPAEGEDFRIVILAEPPEGPHLGLRTRCRQRPRPLAAAPDTIRKRHATYAVAKQPHLPLAPKDIDLLRQGNLFAATPLQVTAEEVFAGGKVRLRALPPGQIPVT